MSVLRTLLVPALLIGGLAGCADSDGDGLTNQFEKKFGLDKDLVDSDGDGLSDGEEVEMGLNPANPDTDSDGYLDGDEVAEGSHPVDRLSGIYDGGWPYNRDKDDIDDPGFSGSNAEGQLFPRVVFKDQHRQDVDIYDYAFQGKPIMIDISAQWCGPCRDMSDWLEGGPAGRFSELNNIRRAVNQGDVFWITVMSQNASFDNPTARTSIEWDEAYPNEHIAVLADRNQELAAWLQLESFPSVLILNEDMTIHEWDPRNSQDGLDVLSDMLPD